MSKVLRVFYLDDEPEIGMIFGEEFSSPTIHITTFIDHEAAILSVKACPPDLMFFDFRLRGTTGDVVALSLDPKIPKFLITGDRKVVSSYAFLDHFDKPCPPDLIHAVLDEYLKKVSGD